MTPATYVERARQYENDIRSGAIAACKWVRLACERNHRDRVRAEAKDPTFPYWFDEVAAARICLAAESLPHIKGPKAKIVDYDEPDQDGKRLPIWATIELEAWQCWFLTTLFGWKQLDGLRRFRVAFMLVPRKNAKSTLAATIVAYMLTADGEGGPECYSVATMREQAKVVGEIVWEMAKRSPKFRDHFGVRMGAKTSRSLEVPSTAGKFFPLSADANTLDGLNISLAVIDELHAHKTRAVWEVVDTATGARLQPLRVVTTTAGVDLGGICYEQMQYLHKVLDRVLEDEQLFGVNYTVDEGDDWRLEATWRKANPNFGVSLQADDLARKAHEAEHSSASVNNFLTKHLNIWVRSASTWMQMEEWLACGNRLLRIDDFREFPCWIGVDLAEVRDIASTVAVIQPDSDHLVVFGRHYLPEAAIDASPIAQYSGWVRDGFLIQTEGDQADFLRIEDDLVAWCDLLNVKEIDFDRALAAQMSQSLKRRLEPRMGKDAIEQFVITVPQTVGTMNPAMQFTERMVAGRKFAHDANPAFNWMISNVVVVRNHKEEVYPRKAGGKDSPNKIDGPVAMFTAMSRVMVAVLEAKSVYLDRGVRTLGE